MNLFVPVLIFHFYPLLFITKEVSCGKIDSKLVESFTDDFSAIMDELELLHNNKSSADNVTVEKPMILPQSAHYQNVTALNSNSNSNNFTASSSRSSVNANSNNNGKKQQRTCACDDSEESLICASNGVTYKSVCRFECAKARVDRLRQVKEGRCSQAAGAQTYWQSNKSG